MTDDIEWVDSFAERARAWVSEGLPSTDDDPLDDTLLQNRIYDAGFGGIAFPPEYGGLGLTLEHQKAFYDIADELDRQVPGKYWVSIGMVAPTILECGSEQAKQRWLRPLLRGDIVCIQLLSEPRGGSDMAGATTRLTRDGDRFVLNGAKMWSTNAHLADYGLCLARSDWELPKHAGLSMIMVPLKGNPAISVRQTRMATGLAGDVCEEFFDDAELPYENLIGEENDGWSVAKTLLFHERNQTAGVGYGYLGGKGERTIGLSDRSTVIPHLLRASSDQEHDNPHVQATADVIIDALVSRLTSERIMRGMALGTHEGPWGSLGKLLSSEARLRSAAVALAIHGADGVVWDGDAVELDNAGTDWLTARIATIGGGTSEIQRNIVSERLLGLPREPSVEGRLPFSEVLRNASQFSRKEIADA